MRNPRSAISSPRHLPTYYEDRCDVSRSLDVYGVGHALVDIQHRVSTDFLAWLGIDKGVMTLIDEQRQQQLLAALEAEPIVCASGGSAANTMIGVARFGGRAHYGCQLGNDEWGDFYRGDLEEAGVGTNPVTRAPGRTGSGQAPGSPYRDPLYKDSAQTFPIKAFAI